MPISAQVPDASPFGTQQGVVAAEGVPSNDEIRTRADASDFGGQIGAGLQNVGGAVQEQATKFAQIYSDLSARDGVTKASQALSDAEMEFKQNKGNNAVAAYKTFQQKAADIGQQYSQTMPNMMAQKQFMDDFSREQSSAIYRSGAYVADQAEEAHVNSLTSSIANSVNQYAMNATNPTGDSYLQSIAHTQGELSGVLGHDPETKQAAISKSVGLAGSAAITTMI